MARQRYVIIADAQIAEELLVAGAAATSSRETSFIGSETLWAGMGVIASQQNNLWRKHRQIIQRGLRSQGSEGENAVSTCY